jgi:DNA-binding MltR family transcriptional regulator
MNLFVSPESVPVLIQAANVESFFSITPGRLDEFRELLPLLNKETDRGLVSLACSFIDELLQQTLLAFFVECPLSASLVEDNNGPLGDLAKRCATAFALGLISEQERKECDVLSKIRSRFEHRVSVSFNNPDIQDLCQNLTLVVKGKPARVLFNVSSAAMMANLMNRAHFVSRQRRKFEPWPY